MRHLSQQMIGMDLRSPHLQRQRRRLRRELQRVDLGGKERRRLEQMFHRVGEPRVYSLDEPPPPGALDPGPMPNIRVEVDVEGATHDTLDAYPHARLYLYARDRGLEVRPGDTKATIVQAILAASQGEDP